MCAQIKTLSVSTSPHTIQHTHGSANTQTHTHAQTLMVMGHGAVYAHIKEKSLISVTGRALAPEELANSCFEKAHPQ